MIQPQSISNRQSTHRLAFLSTQLCVLSIASAASIPVPNGSFESPKPPQGFPASPFVDVWQKSPHPQGIPLPSGISWDQLSGVFPNTAVGSSDRIENMIGDQAAYIFAIPGVSLSQILSSSFEAGMSYQISIGILGAGGITEGSLFSYGLFYMDNANTPVSVGSATISYSSSAFPTVTRLVEQSVATPTVKSSDPWAGKPIGIQLTSTFGTGAGYWDVDNVRVVAVPEPSTLVFLSLGLGALCLSRNRAVGQRTVAPQTCGKPRGKQQSIESKYVSDAHQSFLQKNPANCCWPSEWLRLRGQTRDTS